MADQIPEPTASMRLGVCALEEFTRSRGDLDRFRAGDVGAFEDLWRRYQPALIVLLGRIRARVEPTLRARLDTDDVLQDLAVVVLARIHEFEYRGQGSVLAWMSAIVDRTVSDWLDYWRAGKRHPRAELPRATAPDVATAGMAAVLADSSAGPVTQAVARERGRRLAAAMAILDDRQHLIVFWRFFGGAEWSEIATRLGARSADAVRKECYLQVFPALAAALARDRQNAGDTNGR